METLKNNISRDFSGQENDNLKQTLYLIMLKTYSIDTMKPYFPSFKSCGRIFESLVYLCSHNFCTKENNILHGLFFCLHYILIGRKNFFLRQAMLILLMRDILPKKIVINSGREKSCIHFHKISYRHTNFKKKTYESFFTKLKK